ncbi:cellulase family glycosylhydrolase [Rufibacter hautae]|uniref:Cellulase family glycosylhydrolase n=1 Tax=Rufibacter hautae TaxID=2595005 RepID=A0A5B6TIU9_9BACT|nr:cellulase family glycosylhydrolase [Rufibacter hautae]KAA3439946.1 cellulase family glycosylhydrolase [Rufibacter hautae]
MKWKSLYLLALVCGLLTQGCGKKEATTQTEAKPRTVWSVDKAKAWYKDKGFIIGPNFSPSTAINQLEMWQAESFDTATINRELGWAEDLGMNTARVYLHDLLYQQDSAGFLQRVDTFLDIAQRHNIKPILVIFDSVWDPNPKLGKQREPRPHVHNSGWVQSPGSVGLQDSTQHPRLERYVKGVIRRFANDDRILAWDIWNEPDNINQGSAYGKQELPNKLDYVLPLLKKSFVWARAANPVQPVTSAVWKGNWSVEDSLTAIEKVMLDESDIITFHNYDSAQYLEQRINWLKRYGKPMICTEYMARPNGSTFQSSLPVAKKHNVGMVNWGFVDGKTQTIYPWDSWDKNYTGEPKVWFHDILRKDGTPYSQAEVDLIRSMTGVKEKAVAAQ